MSELKFNASEPLTLGIELELQLIARDNHNLATESADFLRRLDNKSMTGVIKPEITQGMFEINSSVHHDVNDLFAELMQLKTDLSAVAEHSGIDICGGGTHPFQRWQQQRIFPTERYHQVSQRYGFLAQRFTVFGQHIHIGCSNGDDALYLCHALARYLPHFVALSASSPFYQGTDSLFDSSRMTVVSAFPLSGMPPFLLHWNEFEHHFNNMANLGIVESIKDYYWDIRPKPEYGTVEIRICDTPLTMGWAAALAAYAQLLAAWLLENRPPLSASLYLPYSMNRFRAGRYGFSAELIDAKDGTIIDLQTDVLNTLNQLRPYATALHCEEAFEALLMRIKKMHNDAYHCRRLFAQTHSLNDVVAFNSELWRDCASFFQSAII